MTLHLPDCHNIYVKIFVVGYSTQGESIVVLLLDSSDNKVLLSMVIDSFKSDGHNKTINILQSCGIKSLDYLVWSHPDYDHSLDIYSIIRDYCDGASTIILPYGFDGKDYNNVKLNKDDKAIVEEIRKTFESTQFGYSTASAEPMQYKPYLQEYIIDDLGSEVPIELLALSPFDKLINQYIAGNVGGNIPKNSLSIVLYLKIGEYPFVFTSDVEDESIEFLRMCCFLNPVFLKIPHHTSNVSSSLFYGKLVTSEQNTFSCTTVKTASGLPDEELLEKYCKKSVHVHSTGIMNDEKDVCGIIEYTYDLFDKGEVTVKLHGHAQKIN